jgi:thiosulfate reductase cytochrome b subunit
MLQQRSAGSAAHVPRHPRFVRVTHWLTTIAFLGLLVSGLALILSHPRFYWGETGNVNTTPLFVLPVPSSRGIVPTAYDFVLSDQNGWGRYLHFQAAWLVVFTGLAYVLTGARSGHLRRNLVPAKADRSWRAIRRAIDDHLRFDRSALGDFGSYNVLQRLSYIVVVFVLLPLAVWTGLAMAPAFTAVVPSAATLLGGRQSARTLHFFVSMILLGFMVVHLVMIALAGFRERVRGMITGAGESTKRVI